MNEASKAISRRLHDVRFATRYFIGSGIDIGAGNDPVSLYGEFFPGMRALRAWDMPDGDAQLLADVDNESFDFVHSSHCLEHMRDPKEALYNWFRVLKPGGHLVCMVPDEDLYEQGRFPSTFNSDHKWTFTLWKSQSWSDRTVNLFELLQTLGVTAQPLKVELLDATFRYQWPRFDQTQTAVGEAAVEFIVRKRLPDEITSRGRYSRVAPPLQTTF
jgi:SAM-dependent methyltransferase